MSWTNTTKFPFSRWQFLRGIKSSGFFLAGFLQVCQKKVGAGYRHQRPTLVYPFIIPVHCLHCLCNVHCILLHGIAFYCKYDYHYHYHCRWSLFIIFIAIIIVDDGLQVICCGDDFICVMRMNKMKRSPTIGEVLKLTTTMKNQETLSELAPLRSTLADSDEVN